MQMDNILFCSQWFAIHKKMFNNNVMTYSCTTKKRFSTIVMLFWPVWKIAVDHTEFTGCNYMVTPGNQLWKTSKAYWVRVFCAGRVCCFFSFPRVISTMAKIQLITNVSAHHSKKLTPPATFHLYFWNMKDQKESRKYHTTSIY